MVHYRQRETGGWLDAVIRWVYGYVLIECECCGCIEDAKHRSAAAAGFDTRSALIVIAASTYIRRNGKVLTS